MRKAHIVIILGLCAILWGVCIVQVIFYPKALDVTETHVSPVVSYSSTYKSTSAIRIPFVSRPSVGVGDMTVHVPQTGMRPITRGGSQTTIKIHTTSSQRVSVAGSGSGSIATSTSSGNKNSTRGIVYSQASAVPSISGLLTSASLVRGGVTAERTLSMSKMGNARTITHPGNPDEGQCPTCIYDENGICIICGHSSYFGVDEHGECAGHCTHHDCDTGCCCTPLDFNRGAMLFFALLAVGYGVRIKKREKI